MICLILLILHTSPKLCNHEYCSCIPHQYAFSNQHTDGTDWESKSPLFALYSISNAPSFSLFSSPSSALLFPFLSRLLRMSSTPPPIPSVLKGSPYVLLPCSLAPAIQESYHMQKFPWVNNLIYNTLKETKCMDLGRDINSDGLTKKRARSHISWESWRRS